MSEGRASTTLEVKVAARDLSRLDQRLKDIFGPQRARDFARGVAGSERSIEMLTRATSRLTAELTRQRQHAHHYTRMGQEARDARREVEHLRQEVERLTAAQARGPGGVGAGGGGGGMPGSQAGGGYGGWRQAPQLGVPDASGLATAMSAIPFVGLAAAGSTMASYQMYGSALGYQTARRDTFSALGPQGAAMLRLRQTQQARASQTRVSGDPGAVAAAEAAGLDAASDASGVPEWALKGAGMWVKGADTLHGWWNPTLRNARQSYDRMVATGAQARGHSAIEYTPGQSARWNAPLSTADLEQVGMSYGVKPAEALREAAGLSSAMGRRTSAGTYDFARASQTYFGVDMGTTGGLMRGLRTAGGLGGQEEQADAVAELIGSAVARGLEGSEIGEYLSTMAGFMRKQEQMGQSEQSLSGFMLGSERLRRMGFSGEFATSYAMRLGEGASQMGYSGGVDAVKFGLLQQLGYGTGGQYTAEDYAEATLRLQDPETATIAGLGAMGKLSDSMRSSGMSPAVRALMMSRYSGLVGAQVGPDAARRMAAGVAGAGYYETPTTAADITGVHTQARGHAVGILAGEASMEAGRIGAGYKAAGQVQALNGVMIDLANTVQNTAGPALDTLTSKLKQMSAAAASWTPGAGSGVGGAGGG